MSSDRQISFEGVDDASADGGVPHGALLAALADAVHSDDADRIAAARDAVVEHMGGDAMVDAVAVCANFHMMTRIADGTGTPLDPGTVDPSTDIRRQIGVDGFTSRRHVQT